MIQIIALLYASDNGIEALRAFESQVLPILREHGGTLISASSNDNRDSHEPDEVHVIQFPSQIEYEAYKNDIRVMALQKIKETAIKKMDIYVTNQFYDYESD